MKQRLRYKLADTGAWPIDVSLYGEVSETEREVEFEGKIILQRRFGVMRVIANATAEQEFYYDARRDLVLNPSGGITFDALPNVQPGIEWWMHGEYPEVNAPSTRPFELGPHQYVGPTLLLQSGALWWTNGVYVRVTDWNHTLEADNGRQLRQTLDPERHRASGSQLVQRPEQPPRPETGSRAGGSQPGHPSWQRPTRGLLGASMCMATRPTPRGSWAPRCVWQRPTPRASWAPRCVWQRPTRGAPGRLDVYGKRPTRGAPGRPRCGMATTNPRAPGRPLRH